MLAGSYWQTQCVKRDDSIRFLTLKLQEYTVTGYAMGCICKFQCPILSIQFVCYYDFEKKPKYNTSSKIDVSLSKTKYEIIQRCKL